MVFLSSYRNYLQGPGIEHKSEINQYIQGGGIKVLQIWGVA